MEPIHYEVAAISGCLWGYAIGSYYSSQPYGALISGLVGVGLFLDGAQSTYRDKKPYYVQAFESLKRLIGKK